MVSERRVTAARPTISSQVRTFAVFMGPNTPNSGRDGVDGFNNNMTWEEFFVKILKIKIDSMRS